MSTQQSSSHSPALVEGGVLSRFLRATELDIRMVGMIAGLLMIWVGFHIAITIKNSWGVAPENLPHTLAEWWDLGVYLTPRNLWTLLNQTASIAVMATGMVLIIVMRQIDLSVGSILGFTATCIASAQVFWLPAMGLPVGHPAIWIITLIFGLMVGTMVGALNGTLIAYAEVPSFIVTLGGLLFWRAAAFAVSAGVTIAPMDKTFKLIGGGVSGTTPGAIGALASWILCAAVCGLIVFAVQNDRRQRQRYQFPLRPRWAELFITGIACVAVIGTTMVVNHYYWPKGIVERYAAENNLTIPPEGLNIPYGYAAPVLIALLIGATMTFITRRTSFGRYVFAIGGNPEAASLAGINTKRLTMMVFALMGGLAAVSACISSARLDAASTALGVFDELYVIAAAVIGGTSLAGGVGTIYGAMMGALIMQSLQSGMTLMNLGSAPKEMALAVVLVFAVWLDQQYAKRLVK